MRGGTDAAAIHDVAYGAWPNKPSDATVTVNQACTCAGGSASCSTICPDNSYPKAFTTITGSGTYVGPFGSSAITASEVVRTQ
jgi:hypothetical protein